MGEWDKDGCWEVKHAVGKGRGVFLSSSSSSSKVGRGKLVWEEKPVAAVLDEESISSYCDGCFKTGMTLKRCSQCQYLKYCSRQCQKNVWPIHKMECEILQIGGPSKRPTRSMRLMFRIIARNSSSLPEIDDMKQLINHKEELKGKTLEATTQLAMGTHYLLSSYASKKKIENSFSSLSSSFLFSLFASLMSNCLVISDAEMNQIGVGLYKEMAMVNHSCKPNSICTFHGTNLLVRASCPIEKGEELTICYVEKGRPKEQRIKDLQESFFFQCSCSLCSPLSLSSRSLGSVSCSSSFPKYGEDVLELSEKMMKAIVCPQCSGYGIVINQGKEKEKKEEKEEETGEEEEEEEGERWECENCKTIISYSEFSQKLFLKIGKYKKKENLSLNDIFVSNSCSSLMTNFDFKDAKTDDLFSLVSSLSSLLHQHNYILFSLSQSLFQCLLCDERWIDALEIGVQLVPSFYAYYGRYWPAVAFHNFKVGKLQMLIGITESLQSFEEAATILSITHGERHPLTLEALENVEKSRLLSFAPSSLLPSG